MPWRPSSGPGWVYVLTNPSLPGVCKIGRTRRAPAVRVREVNRAYGVALPFEVASKHFTPDAAAVEWMAHRALTRDRFPTSELFRVDPARAADAIKAAVLAYRPPSRRWRWLRRLLTSRPRHSPRRSRRGTNWLPLVLGLSITAGAVAVIRPHVPSWLPPPIAHTIDLLERTR